MEPCGAPQHFPCPPGGTLHAPTQCLWKPGIIMGRTHPGAQHTGSNFLTAFCTQMHLDPTCSEGAHGVHPISQVGRGASARTDNMRMQTRSVACEERKKGPLCPVFLVPHPPGQQAGSRSDNYLTMSSRQDARGQLLPQQIWRGSQRKLRRPTVGGR